MKNTFLLTFALILLAGSPLKAQEKEEAATLNKVVNTLKERITLAGYAQLGYTYDDFQDPRKMNYVEQYTVARKFAEILNKAYENGEPILENNGQMMWVSGCVYANGTYPD